jgi:hypothetical protein
VVAQLADELRQLGMKAERIEEEVA